MKGRHGVWILAVILMMAGIFISSCYGTQLHDKGTYAIVMKSRARASHSLA